MREKESTHAVLYQSMYLHVCWWTEFPQRKIEREKKKVKVAHLVKLSLNMYAIICDLVPFS